MAPAHEARCMCRRGYLDIQRPFDGGFPFVGFHDLSPPGLFTSVPPGAPTVWGCPTSSNGSSAASSAAGFLSLAPCGSAATTVRSSAWCRCRARAARLLGNSCLQLPMPSQQISRWCAATGLTVCRMQVALAW